MPSADKRQRKKENARVAREARIAAEKRSRRLKSVRNVAIIVALFVVMVLVVNWVQSGGSKKSASDTSTTTTPAVAYPAGCVKTQPKVEKKQTYSTAPPMTIDVNKTYVAHFETTCGNVDVTLDPKTAPKTVNSFVYLARQKFYDGLTFHRVAKDSYVQGGDPQGNGRGGPGYQLPTEGPEQAYTKESVAMANAGPGTTNSQFFFFLSDAAAKGLSTGTPPYLYSELGTVTKGYDVVQKLGSLYNQDQTSDPSTQKTSVPLYMFKVTISES